MKLLTKEIEKKLDKSPLYSTDGKQVKNVIVKFFCPFNAFTFLVFEGEKQGDDYLFYGAATMGYGYELGYYTLSELQKVKKFGGSIMAGIMKMLEYNIHIVKGSDNLVRELKNYTYMQDKNGNFINKPIDAYNHAIDASRYWVLGEILGRVSKAVDISENDIVIF